MNLEIGKIYRDIVNLGSFYFIEEKLSEELYSAIGVEAGTYFKIKNSILNSNAEWIQRLKPGISKAAIFFIFTMLFDGSREIVNEIENIDIEGKIT